MPVVAAIDQSERAGPVIEQAAQLADDAGVSLHVVHVGSVGVPNPEGGYDAESEEEITKKRAVHIARDAVEKVDDIEAFEPVGLVGNPAEEILEYSTAENAEYIVVSARKRSPLGQAVFGSVTQSLLLNAERPVVAIPHGPD